MNSPIASKFVPPIPRGMRDPLNAPAPLMESGKVETYATASVPDPAEPEPVTISWAWADDRAFRPYAIPTEPSMMLARSPVMISRESNLAALAKFMTSNTSWWLCVSLSEFRCEYFSRSIECYIFQEKTMGRARRLEPRIPHLRPRDSTMLGRPGSTVHRKPLGEAEQCETGRAVRSGVGSFPLLSSPLRA